MTSRGRSPLMVSMASPTTHPGLRSAGEPGSTATTWGSSTGPGYGRPGRPPRLAAPVTRWRVWFHRPGPLRSAVGCGMRSNDVRRTTGRRRWRDSDPTTPAAPVRIVRDRRGRLGHRRPRACAHLLDGATRSRCSRPTSGSAATPTPSTVDDPEAGPLGIDTGFIVHNDRNYPNLLRLFDRLDVATQPSEMSFGVEDRRHRLRLPGHQSGHAAGPPGQRRRPPVLADGDATSCRFFRHGRRDPRRPRTRRVAHDRRVPRPGPLLRRLRPSPPADRWERRCGRRLPTTSPGSRPCRSCCFLDNHGLLGDRRPAPVADRRRRQPPLRRCHRRSLPAARSSNSVARSPPSSQDRRRYRAPTAVVRVRPARASTEFDAVWSPLATATRPRKLLAEPATPRATASSAPSATGPTRRCSTPTPRLPAPGAAGPGRPGTTTPSRRPAPAADPDLRPDHPAAAPRLAAATWSPSTPTGSRCR